VRGSAEVESADEAELVRRIAKGDQAAFVELYRRTADGGLAHRAAVAALR
jgi:hypothetical protein